MTDHSRHPTWCARGHRCGLGEHRTTPLTITVPGLGTAVLTRVLDNNRNHHAEIRIRIALHHNETTARGQLADALADLRTLIHHMTTTARRAA